MDEVSFQLFEDRPVQPLSTFSRADASNPPARETHRSIHVPSTLDFRQSSVRQVHREKGQIHRPSCSRCVEEETSCSYSQSKRKPGPRKGFSRKRLNIGAANPDLDFQRPSPTSTELAPQDVEHLFISTDGSLSQHAHNVVPALERTFSRFTESSLSVQKCYQRGLADSQLLPTQERDLLEDFFTYVHPSIPLFRKEIFLRKYEQEAVNRDLLLTILGVTAHTQRVMTKWSHLTFKNCLEYQLSSNHVREETLGTSLFLENFQQACLLAFYEFHQYPGRKGWRRISNLTRKAYEYGLNQIDNREHCPLYDQKSITEAQIEEWRCLWWCIYCLDSYCNVTAATPFVIGLGNVRTALLQIESFTNSLSRVARTIFLPSETELLWKTTKEIIAYPGNPNPNLHLVTATLLREAGLLLGSWKQNPSASLKARFSILEDSLSAVRLALPARYLDVARNVRVNESNAEHHARLICILHLHAAHILISLPIQEPVNSAEWLIRWQQTLDYCVEIIAVVKKWKAQLCKSVDPAICLIISGVLLLLHLHSRNDINADKELQTRLRMQKDLLVLFLDQFASIWQLPRLLIVSVQNFTEKFSNSLTSAEIDQILWKSQGILHQSWFSLLSLASQNPESDEKTLSESDFGDWEPLPNVSNIRFAG